MHLHRVVFSSIYLFSSYNSRVARKQNFSGFSREARKKKFEGGGRNLERGGSRAEGEGKIPERGGSRSFLRKTSDIFYATSITAHWQFFNLKENFFESCDILQRVFDQTR